MHGNDLINLARQNLGDPEIATVKDAVLALHGHGVADDTTGNVEAPCGHVIRVDRFIVTTDERGFTELIEYADADLACSAFAEYEDEYADWETESRADFGDISEDQSPEAIAEQVEAAYGRAEQED